MAFPVTSPFSLFTDRSGDPLEEGFLYVGAANQNPQTNPITVYWDSETTIPATQPLRISNGYLNRNGTPANVFANESFSITVRGANGALIYSQPQIQTGMGNLADTSSVSNGDALVGFKQSEASGVLTGATARTVHQKLQEWPSVSDAGAVGNGSTNNSAFFAAAQLWGRLVYIPKPATGYDLTTPVATSGGAWLPEPGATWAQFGDSGQLDMHRGFFTGAGNGANIWRLQDRVFIGEAASKWAGSADGVSDAGTSWFGSDTDCPAFLGVNAQVLVISPENSDSGGRYAIVGAVKTSSNTNAGAIAVSGAVLNTKASATGWGLYADLSGTGTSGQTIGLEIAAKNRRSGDTTMMPNAQTNGVFGVWLAGGGSSNYGGASTFPSTAGMVLIKNPEGGNTWNTGIVMMVDALTAGRAMALSSVGAGGAHYIGWYDATDSEVFVLKCSATGATAWTLLNDNNGLNFLKNAKNMLQVTGAASAVNGVLVFGDMAGSPPQLIAQGDDTNIDLTLTPKGTGKIRFGAHTVLGAETVSGYITIKDAGGTLRKIAVIS